MVHFAVGQVVRINRCDSRPSRLGVRRSISLPSTSKSFVNPGTDDSDEEEIFYVPKYHFSPSGSDSSGAVQPPKGLLKDSVIDDTSSSSDTDDKNSEISVAEPPKKVNRLSEEEEDDAEYCVIYDWDSMCVESEETLEIMGEKNASLVRDQPFYRVLLHGGSSSYLAQQHLRHTKKPHPIYNPLLGRYFRAYVAPYYIPNMQKAYEYPEDATIREQDAFTLSLL